MADQRAAYRALAALGSAPNVETLQLLRRLVDEALSLKDCSTKESDEGYLASFPAPGSAVEQFSDDGLQVSPVQRQQTGTLTFDHHEQHQQQPIQEEQLGSGLQLFRTREEVSDAEDRSFLDDGLCSQCGQLAHSESDLELLLGDFELDDTRSLLYYCVDGSVDDLDRVFMYGRHSAPLFAALVRELLPEEVSRLIDSLTGRQFEDDSSVLARTRRLQLVTMVCDAREEEEVTAYAKLLTEHTCVAWVMLALATESPVGAEAPINIFADTRRSAWTLHVEALTLLGMACALAPRGNIRISNMLQDEVLVAGLVEMGAEHAFDMNPSLLDGILRTLLAMIPHQRKRNPSIVSKLLVSTTGARELGGHFVALLNRADPTDHFTLPNSLCLLRDIFSCRETADLFYTTEFEVLLDVILRNLRNLNSEQNDILLQFIQLLRGILRFHPMFETAWPDGWRESVKSEFSLVLLQLHQLHGQDGSNDVLEELEILFSEAPYLKT